MNSHSLQSLLIYLMAFIMGASVMVIELLGSKLLAPYSGTDIYTWGSLLFVFMIGLASGYYVGGQCSLRHPTLPRFGWIFACTGAALVPMMILSDIALELIFLSIEDTRISALISALVLFFVPAVMMGMASPYAIRLLVADRNESGQVAGRLYFVSTVGSGLGTLLTSFYLVTLFPINHILLSCAALLIIIGMLAIALPDRQAEVSHV